MPTSPSVPLLTKVPNPGAPPGSEPPAVLSYFAMRRAAGYIGFILPIAVVLYDHWHPGCVPSSVSASYYTGVRNFFIGSLCSVGIFLVTSIGYKDDRPYSIFAGVMAFLVAFSPSNVDTTCQLPAANPPFPSSPIIHTVAAVSLFLTFAWFCLVLFCRSPKHPKSIIPKLAGLPSQKRKRNVTFIACGSVMLVAMIYYAAAAFLLPRIGYPEPRYALLVVEWVCLWAFALAWLVKGQQLIKD